MKLNLRCAICDIVKESPQDTEDLREADAGEVCPACFICADCLSENAETFHSHVTNHLANHLEIELARVEKKKDMGENDF